MTDREDAQALSEAIYAKWDRDDSSRTHTEQAEDVIDELRESGWVLRGDGPDLGITEGSPLGQSYMTRPELYREACTPRQGVLDEHFVASLRWRIIQDDPGYWDKERDNHFSQPWAVALRAAIGEAWDSYREAEYMLSHESHGSYTAEAHGKRYVAIKVIRSIARELYRTTVPDDERIL